jgi:hypothetical protein
VASRAGGDLTAEIDEMLATRVYFLAAVDGHLTRQVDSLNSIIMLIMKKKFIIVLLGIVVIICYVAMKYLINYCENFHINNLS